MAAEGTRTTHIIAIGNQKGGVGKTTTTVHLARALAELGRRVLIFDLDANHGATNHFAIPDSYLGTYEVLLGSETPESVLLTRDSEEEITLPENVDIIPANRRLENIEGALREKDKMMEPHRVLLEPLQSLRGVYDYVLLDTAPNASIPTIATYKAAEWFILAALPETFAIQGLAEALSDILAVRKHGNPGIRVLGVAICNADKRTRLSKQLLDYVEEQFMVEGVSRKFDTVIPRSTVVSAAQKLGKTVFETEPDHKVTQAYRALAREVEGRLAAVRTSDGQQQVRGGMVQNA